jgi:DNA-binding CsgD family transcriptional regulator
MGSNKSKLSPLQIRRVKKLIGKLSLQEIARQTGISYYAVWSIKENAGLGGRKKARVIPEEGRYFSWNRYPDGVIV